MYIQHQIKVMSDRSDLEMSDKKYQTIVIEYEGDKPPLARVGVPVLGCEVVSISMKDEFKRSLDLEDSLHEIFCFEEEGHRFDSDDSLAQIFNICRKHN